MPELSLRNFSIRRVQGSETERETDVVAVEEPLAISLRYRFKAAVRSENLALTMRTPGHDQELAVGLLLSEGVIECASDVVRCDQPSDGEITVELAESVDVEQWRLRRNTILSSSCGICGKTSREALPRPTERAHDTTALASEMLYRMPDLLRAQQTGFAQTGGLHAACAITPDGQLEAAFEDIGRHNALDKLIGSYVLQNLLPLAPRIIFLSSRGSFELVSKLAMAGGAILATVGGPSSLAIETARDWNITLIGFLRDRRFNVYSGEWRLKS